MCPEYYLVLHNPYGLLRDSGILVQGFATAKLLLPKIIIFGIPQSRDFRRSNFAVAKPPYQQQAKNQEVGKEGSS